MILVTGHRSTIVQALAQLMPHETIQPLRKRSSCIWDLEDVPQDSRIVLAAGFMAGKPIAELTDEEVNLSRILNAEEPTMIATQALIELRAARICVIGSWSARTGSYDVAYAVWKAALHRWVERQAPRLEPPQQLCCVAPPIIADSGMTRRRADYPGVLERRPHCFAIDVARVIKAALFEADPGATREHPILLMPATAGPEPRTCPC